MKEFRKSVAELEHRYKSDWLSWLGKLLDTTQQTDNTVVPSVRNMSVIDEEQLWERLHSFIRATCQRSSDKLMAPEMQRFLKEFNVDRDLLATLPKKEERENYIISCVRKMHEEPLKGLAHGRKSLQNGCQAERRPTKPPATPQHIDAFDWFDVRSKYPYLKPKVKRMLVKSAYESDDTSPCHNKAEAVVEELRAPDFQENWDEEKELLMHKKIKQLKEMFRQRNPLKPGKSKSVTDNQYNTIAFDDIGHQLKETKSPDRGALLRKFLENQDGLTLDEMKYLLDTSPLMNKAIDRNFIKGKVHKFNSDEIDQIELRIADEIIRKFSSCRDYIKDARNEWKRKRIGQTIRKIKRFERVQQNRSVNQSVRRELKKLRGNVEKQLKFAGSESAATMPFTMTSKCWPVSLNQNHPPSALFCASNENLVKANNYEKTYLQDVRSRYGKSIENQHNVTSTDLRMFYTGGSSSAYRISPKMEQENKQLLKKQLTSYYASMLLHEQMTARQAASQQNPADKDKENNPSQINSSRHTHRGSQRQMDTAMDNIGNRRLFTAVMQNNTQVFRGLVKEVTPKDLQAADRYNNTVLYYAVRNRSTEMVETLLKLGAQVQKRCYRGETPLHLACRMNNLDLINLLLKYAEYGSMEIPCDQGKTPLMRIIDRSLLSRLQVPAQQSARN